MLENLVTIIKIIEIKYELTQLVIYQIRVDPRQRRCSAADLHLFSAYVKSRFSHDAAHIISIINVICKYKCHKEPAYYLNMT